MELSEIYQNQEVYNPKKVNVSFEIFPPKDGDISMLFDELRILKKYNPTLVSLTYGANGGTRSFSIDILRMILDLEMNAMPHFTCVCSSKEIIEHYIIQIENMGIENILALRGDIPEDVNVCNFDFKYANELVKYIKDRTTLSIGVAGYPEGHIECDNLQNDIDYLKRKVDAGASAIFTQLFFENDKFFRYVERVRNAGIDLPIIPGIMPIRSVKQIQNMTSMARIEIPKTLADIIENHPDNIKDFGIDFISRQCNDLIKFGVNGLHFFTLNHSDLTSQILDNIK